VYQNFIPCLYEAQHVSGDTSPIIRSLKLHKQPLVLHKWKVVWMCGWWTLSADIIISIERKHRLPQQILTCHSPDV